MSSWATRMQAWSVWSEEDLLQCRASCLMLITPCHSQSVIIKSVKMSLQVLLRCRCCLTPGDDAHEQRRKNGARNGKDLKPGRVSFALLSSWKA